MVSDVCPVRCNPADPMEISAMSKDPVIRGIHRKHEDLAWEVGFFISSDVEIHILRIAAELAQTQQDIAKGSCDECHGCQPVATSNGIQ